MAVVNPGYRGIAYFDAISSYVRFADANITATQEVVAPDLIMGDADHDAYYYGPITVGGTISGPVTETFGSSGGLFEWAVQRPSPCRRLDDSDITLYYYCDSDGIAPGGVRTFTGMKCNSVNFSCTAGDVANFSIDLKGITAGSWSSATPPDYTTAEKLITWDKVSVAVTGSGPGATELQGANINYSAFDFTVSNNIDDAYSLSQTTLFPVDIVEGLRTITGTLTVYNTPHVDGVDSWDDYIAATVTYLTFNIGGLSLTMAVQLHRVQPASSTGLITSTVGFTGVTHQTGSPWE